ncbi:MAG TPA: hypothetical protein VHY59_07445 [Chthoniobacterales bacterium]|jgi:hypothetical protein|nr:hypothetical protein [Chthoniobacterales bacterium]
MVDKSMLERNISRKAMKQIDEDLAKLKHDIENNPIGWRLTIEIGDKKWRLAPMLRSLSDGELKTNFNDVVAELKEKYEEEEIRNLTSKLENIAYLFEQGGE